MDAQAQALLQQRTAQWQEVKSEELISARLRLAITGILSRVAHNAANEEYSLSGESATGEFYLPGDIALDGTAFSGKLTLQEFNDGMFFFVLDLFGGEGCENEVYAAQVALGLAGDIELASELTYSRYYTE